MLLVIELVAMQVEPGYKLTVWMERPTLRAVKLARQPDISWVLAKPYRRCQMQLRHKDAVIPYSPQVSVSEASTKMMSATFT